MSYFVNKNGGVASLTIGGVQYADSLVAFLCSDSSGKDTGYVKTEGQVILRQKPGGKSIEDYSRTSIGRGTVVIIDIKNSDNAAVRHPRGYLLVLRTLYEASNENLIIEVGCKLAYAELLDSTPEELKGMPRFNTPEGRNSFEDLGRAIAADARFVYQNNQGVLLQEKFYGNDTISSTAPGAWTAVRGITCLSVEQLDARDTVEDSDGGGGAPEPNRLPADFEDVYEGPYLDDDELEIEYQEEVIEDEEEEDNFGGEPVVIPTPETPGGLTCPVEDLNDAVEPRVDSNEGGVCQSDGFTTERRPLWVSASSREESSSKYEGPGLQLSSTLTVRTGPAVEANNQYFADLYHNCVQSSADECNVNGNCGISSGMTTITLSKTTTENKYDASGALVSTVQENWVPRIAGAQPVDWRAGIEKGMIIGFRTPSNAYGLYRVSAVKTTYEYSETKTVSRTTTYNSITTRQSGISGANIDAYNGIVSKTKRTSIAGRYSANNDPDAPDTLAGIDIELEDKVFVVPSARGDVDSSGTPTPREGLKYTLSVPYPLLLGDTGLTAPEVISDYALYTYFTIVGESRGLRIQESMRDDIVTGWKPNQPFYYCDPQRGKIVSMRGSSWSWGVSSTESIVSVDGLFMGIIDGTLSVPNNVVGNTTPVLP